MQIPGQPEQHGAERGEHQKGGEEPSVLYGHPSFREHPLCGSWRQDWADWSVERGELALPLAELCTVGWTQVGHSLEGPLVRLRLSPSVGVTPGCLLD